MLVDAVPLYGKAVTSGDSDVARFSLSLPRLAKKPPCQLSFKHAQWIWLLGVRSESLY